MDLVLLGVPDAALAEQVGPRRPPGARCGGVRFGPRTRAGDDHRHRPGSGHGHVRRRLYGVRQQCDGAARTGLPGPDPLPAGGVSSSLIPGSAFSTLLRAHRHLQFPPCGVLQSGLVTDTADYVDYALDDPRPRASPCCSRTPRAAPRLRAALDAATERGVPVVILAVGHSPRGSAMVATSGICRRRCRVERILCTDGSHPGTGHGRDGPTPSRLFESGRRPGQRTRHRHRARLRGRTCAVCRHRARSGVPFADLRRRHGRRHRRPARRRPGGHQPAGRLGHRCRDPGVVRELPAAVAGPGGRGDCARRGPGHRFDGDTAYPDALIDVSKATAAPIAVVTSVESAIDRTAAKQLRAQGIPVLEGARSSIAALGHLARWPLPVNPSPVEIDANAGAAGSRDCRLGSPDVPSICWPTTDPRGRVRDRRRPLRVLAAADESATPSS